MICATLPNGAPRGRRKAAAARAATTSSLAMAVAGCGRAALKEKHHPGIITYSRKVFLPLTNLCRDYCGYCTYRRDPGEPGAHTMTPDEVLAVAQQAKSWAAPRRCSRWATSPKLSSPRCARPCASMGYRSTLHYLRSHVRAGAARNSPAAACQSRPAERQLDRAPARQQSQPRPDAGEHQHRLPAGASARTTLPTKLPALRLKTIEDAGKLGVPFTTGILIGIGETLRGPRRFAAGHPAPAPAYGHVQEVIIQNFRAKPRDPDGSVARARHGDMLRTLAVARLLLRDMNIQAPPNLTENGYERLLRGRDQRLGRGFAADARLHQSRSAVAASAATCSAAPKPRDRNCCSGLPVYPEFVASVRRRGGLLARATAGCVDRHGYARAA